MPTSPLGVTHGQPTRPEHEGYKPKTRPLHYKIAHRTQIKFTEASQVSSCHPFFVFNLAFSTTSTSLLQSHGLIIILLMHTQEAWFRVISGSALYTGSVQFVHPGYPRGFQGLETSLRIFKKFARFETASVTKLKND